MDVMKTHGAISWSELMTSDAGKACEFYKGLFGWKIETMPMPQGDYHVVKVGDTSIAGIMATPADGPPMPPAWGSYVTVDDVDASAKLAVALGGTLCAGPMDIPGVGRFAVIQDPQGAVLNMMTYAAS
ncbi:MAG: VOC family protein [Aquabacterium sp.]